LAYTPAKFIYTFFANPYSFPVLQTQQFLFLYEKMTLIGIREVAGLFHCTEKTIRRWIAGSRRGENVFPLPLSDSQGKPIGKKLLWTQQSIENFLASAEQRSEYFLRIVQKEMAAEETEPEDWSFLDE
jgi:hypothetical protein